MKISFTQVYVEPGRRFPFSQLAQVELSGWASPLLEASPQFAKKYGADFGLCFNLSAKSKLEETEIRGPSVFRKGQDVEYTIFLPFDVIQQSPTPYAEALRYLLQAVAHVCERFEMDTARLLQQQDAIINRICSDPKMFRVQPPGVTHNSATPIDESSGDISPDTDDEPDDHDPFNEPERTHPRARELMPEEFFWDCVDEEAPFGSDEGWEAYYEFRHWRAKFPESDLVDCLSWIMSGKIRGYTQKLCTDRAVQQALDDPETAFLGEEYDLFTLDATVIGTALGQLFDEGRIDASAKPFIHVALNRQLHPLVLTSEHRRMILQAIQRVVDAA